MFQDVKPLSTAEVCELFQISKSTLFRWEREGIIPAAQRDIRHANQRLYGREQLTAIRNKLIAPVYKSACEADDIDAMSLAYETLYMQKIRVGEEVGLEELISLSDRKDMRLSSNTLKQLLKVLAESFDPADDRSLRMLRLIWENCPEAAKTPRH